MIDHKTFEVDRGNPEEDSTFNSTMTISSPKNFSTELIDASIEDVRNKKITLVSKMDSLINLMKKVECEERAAKQAKEEADWSSFDILAKVDERKQALIKAEETNNMLVKKVYVQKAVLATKMEVLQFHMAHLLDDGDRSLGVLDEMNRSLEMRLTSALLKKELALKRKEENEALSQVVLAYVDFQMEKIVEESNRWKQEALEISKLLEFLKDRGNVVDMLHDEISDECQDLNHLKEDLDQAIPLGGLLLSNQKLSSLAASSSSLNYSNTDRVKDVVSKADLKIPHMVEVVSEGQTMSTIECNDFGENSGVVGTREVNKLCRDQMFAKNVKKMKTNNILHQKCAKRIKKVKIKGLRVVSERSAAVHHKEDGVDDIEVLPRVRNRANQAKSSKAKHGCLKVSSLMRRKHN